MARYTGPITRKSRRLRVDLVGGDQAFERRPYPPGQHGRARIKESEYLLQLQEKQKARFTYGVMEKQFRLYYKEANNRPGKTGENLLRILESRLDNVVYRSGFAKSRPQARQLVGHRHIEVNGRVASIPSRTVRAGDIVTVREPSRSLQYFKDALAWAKTQPRPGWLEVDPDSYTARMVTTPTRDQIETQVDTQLIVEHYSR